MDTSTQILDLLTAGGQDSPDMTHALKTIGGGNMKAGLRALANFMHDQGRTQGVIEGYTLGAKNGMLKGSLITASAFALIGVCIGAYKRHKHHAELEQQRINGEKMLCVIQESIQTPSQIEFKEEYAKNDETEVNDDEEI